MKYSPDTQQKINTIAKAVEDDTGLKIIASGLYGSVMRGYPDPNSDLDVCLLVQRPVSDYVGITWNKHFRHSSADERRQYFMDFSSRISKATGIRTMVSLVDTKDMLVGLMNNTPFAICAYEHFSYENQHVKDLFEEVIAAYEDTSTKISRLGTNVRKSVTNYATTSMDVTSDTAYRRERAYLSILWHMHRLLAYVSGDTISARPLEQLIEFNREIWSEKFPELFSSIVLGVWKARINRSHFDLPNGILPAANTDLIAVSNRVLAVASEYLTANPMIPLSSKDIAHELVDLYSFLMDKEIETA